MRRNNFQITQTPLSKVKDKYIILLFYYSSVFRSSVRTGILITKTAEVQLILVILETDTAKSIM